MIFNYDNAWEGRDSWSAFDWVGGIAAKGRGKTVGGWRFYHNHLVELQKQAAERQQLKSLMDAHAEVNRQAYLKAVADLTEEQARQNAIFAVLLSEL